MCSMARAARCRGGLKHCRTHGREAADEVRRAGDQLDGLRGKAADEVQLVALPPMTQGGGRDPGTALVVASACWHPQPHVPLAGALAQLQHHANGAGDLAEVGAGAANRDGAEPCCSTAMWPTSWSGFSCSRTWRSWAACCWWPIRTAGPETTDFPEPEKFSRHPAPAPETGGIPPSLRSSMRSCGTLQGVAGS
jgi:hypothetical protein